MHFLMKAKAAAQGETRTWADGKTRKKVGKKWIVVEGGVKTEERQAADAWRRGRIFFDHSLATNLGVVVADVLQDYDVSSYNDLIEKIKTGSHDTAHRIYKDVVDRIRETPGTVGERKAVVDPFGRALIQIRDQYAIRPKTKLTVTRVSKKGKTYRTYDEGKHSPELPSMKPSVVQAAQRKMGGWSVTGTLLSTHIQKMLRAGGAKIVSGKVSPRKAWILPKKAVDMQLSYKGDVLKIIVKQVAQKEQRTRATAKVEISIPYALAKAFLMTQVDSKRTRNNFIYRMERSPGYRDYLEAYGAM